MMNDFPDRIDGVDLPLRITRQHLLGWVVQRPHHITKLPQVVATHLDRDEAIRLAAIALGAK